MDMKKRLTQAQAGDEDAISEVAIYVFNKYRGRIVQLARQALDPAIALEDMEMTFFEAIMGFVPKADGRGDDFYHIGQRGVWAVQSELRTAQRQTRQRAWARTVMEETGREPEYERVQDRCEPDFREIVHGRVDGEELVRVIANAPMSARAAEAVDIILREGLDPTEQGFNKDLAGRLGVSPQRTSQIMAGLREGLEAAR